MHQQSSIKSYYNNIVIICIWCVVKKNIENENGNLTRFLVMGKNISQPEFGDKKYITSFLFKLKSKPAALYQSLGGFAINGVNLSGNQGYFDNINGSGTSYLPGDVISTTTILYIFDQAGNCTDEEFFAITIAPTPSPKTIMIIGSIAVVMFLIACSASCSK